MTFDRKSSRNESRTFHNIFFKAAKTEKLETHSKVIFLTAQLFFSTFQMHILDLNVLKLQSHSPWTARSISGAPKAYCWDSRSILTCRFFSLRERRAGGGAAAGETAAAGFQQLWNLAGPLVHRAQEPNIPFGESLTSTNTLLGSLN